MRIAITEARNCNLSAVWRKIAEKKFELDNILYGFDRRYLLFPINQECKFTYGNESKTKVWQRLPILLNDNAAFELSCNTYCKLLLFLKTKIIQKYLKNI